MRQVKSVPDSSAEQTGSALLHERVDARHVENGHPFRDADNEWNSSIGGSHHRVGGEWRRDVDHRRIGARILHRFGNRVEDWNLILEFLAALARSYTANDLGAVLDHLLCMERAVPTGDALHDEAGVFFDENAHAAFPPVARATAFFTASSMSVIADIPFSLRIFSAISSLVPVSRITSGTLSGFCFIAVTIPLATSSVRVIPPKMLKRIALTLGSLVMMRSAATTFSGFDEPPMSRKFAGSPP